MAQASDLIIMPTGYSLDDMDPQIETAYELEEPRHQFRADCFIFYLADGSASEEVAARRYIKKPVSMCLILFSRKDHLFGRLTIRAGRPVKFRYPSIRSKVLPLAKAIVDQLNQNHKKPWLIKV